MVFPAVWLPRDDPDRDSDLASRPSAETFCPPEDALRNLVDGLYLSDRCSGPSSGVLWRTALAISRRCRSIRASRRVSYLLARVPFERNPARRRLDAIVRCDRHRELSFVRVG